MKNLLLGISLTIFISCSNSEQEIQKNTDLQEIIKSSNSVTTTSFETETFLEKEYMFPIDTTWEKQDMNSSGNKSVVWTKYQSQENEENLQYSQISCLVTPNSENYKLKEVVDEIIIDLQKGNEQRKLFGWNGIKINGNQAYILYYQNLDTPNHYSLDLIKQGNNNQIIYLLGLVHGYNNPKEKLKELKAILANIK